MENSKTKKTVVILSGIAVLAIIVVIIELFFLHAQSIKLKNTNQDLINTQQQLQTLQDNFSAETAIEDKYLISKVGGLMTLPANEQPTIAVLADLSKLQGIPFFAEAQVGDALLIYTDSNKVILYRPITNTIVNSSTLEALQSATK